MSSTNKTQKEKIKEAKMIVSRLKKPLAAEEPVKKSSQMAMKKSKSRRKTANIGGSLLERRNSLIKYLDRTSTAADKFRMEEQQWLSEDALGFAPMTSDANKDRHEKNPVVSCIEEHDELMDDIDVHELNDDDIFGSSFNDDSSALNNDKVENTKEKTLRSRTSILLDSDSDSGVSDEAKVATDLYSTERKKPRGKSKSVTAHNFGQHKYYHEFKHLLTTKNAIVYRKKNMVRAFQTNSPVRFEKEWGISEGQKGDWVVWNGDGDMHCIKDKEFVENYIPARRIHSNNKNYAHQYIKNKTVSY